MLNIRIKNGKNAIHQLFAVREGMEPVLISTKDHFRKLIEFFMHLNKYKLYVKIHKAQVEQGLK